MARILGLDLGSYSVKAVLIDSSVRAKPLQAFFEIPRAEGERWATLKQALTQLFKEHPMQVDQVVIALPGPALATHSLTLPFSDPKRLEAALPFEVEGQLPFDLSEAVFDYQVTAHHPGKSDVWVGIVRREELTALLALFTELGLDPRIVTHPAVAYQSFWLVQPKDTSVPVAIVDIGHERTSVAIGTPVGGLETARTFAGGGKELTRALANELQISLPEASRWKEEQREDERAALAVQRGLQPILREVRATLKAYNARTHRHVGQIYLCGGTSKLNGISEQLTKDLGLPCSLWEAPPELTSVTQDSAGAAAQAYVLALRGQLPTARAPRFNLRRGDFAFKGHYDYLRVRMSRLALYAASLFFLFIVFGLLRNVLLGQRESAVDDQLCRVTQNVLGHCDRNYDRALNMLKGKESPGAAVPKVSAVNILAELTHRMPADAAVTFDQIMVNPDRVTLRGTTDSSRQIDRIKDALKAFRCFHEIQVGKLEKTKDDHVNFRLEIQVECPEQGITASAG